MGEETTALPGSPHRTNWEEADPAEATEATEDGVVLELALDCAIFWPSIPTISPIAFAVKLEVGLGKGQPPPGTKFDAARHCTRVCESTAHAH
jgi:hypothetical protein